MKKLLLSLITLSVILTGCGKDNKTSTGATAATTVTSTITTGASSLSEAISNNRFASTDNLRYQRYDFERYVITTEDKCSSKYITCNYTDADLDHMWQVTHDNLPNLETKKAELLAIVNSASSVDNTYFSSGVVDVYNSQGVGYRFDLRLPIYANPVLIVDSKNRKVTQLKRVVLY